MPRTVWIVAILTAILIVVATRARHARLAKRFGGTAPASREARDAAERLRMALETLRSHLTSAHGMLVAPLETSIEILTSAPATYANYLAVYKGLSDSDESLLRVAANTGGDLAIDIRRVVASVHALGAALEVE